MINFQKMFSHPLFAVISFSLFLLPFTSQFDLKVQIIGWRHLEAYSHLLSLTPANRFEITLSKNGQSATEPPVVCRTGHYDVATLPMPDAWLSEGKRKSQKTSDFVGGNGLVLSIFTPSDGKHHGIIHFHLLSRRYFVRVALTGDGNPPFAKILLKQQLKLPVKHLLFKIQEQPSKSTIESMVLLKRIECQSGGWSIEDETAGQKVLLRKWHQVCEDDVYLMHYAQIEEVGQMGRREVPKQANRMSPAAVKLVMDSGQQNIIDIWPQVDNMKLVSGNTAKRQKITPPPAAPSHLQQLRIVNAFVEKNPKLQAVIVRLKSIKENSQNKSNFRKKLSKEECKTLSNALAYLGQAADYKLGTQAVADVLGIGNTTVAANRDWVQVRSGKAKPMSGRSYYWPVSEEKMQQSLKNIEEDAQKQTSQHPAAEVLQQQPTTNVDNEENNIHDYDVEIAKQQQQQQQQQHQEHQEKAKRDFLQSIGEDEPSFSKEDLDNYIALMDDDLPSSSAASEQQQHRELQRQQHLHGEHICDMTNRNLQHSTGEFPTANPRHQLISPSSLPMLQHGTATEENNRSLDKGKGKATIIEHEDDGSQQPHQQPEVGEEANPPDVHRNHSNSDAELDNWDLDILPDLDWDL